MLSESHSGCCIIFIPTLTAGGAEKVASILANVWSRKELVDVAVVTLFDEPDFYKLTSKVQVICLGLKSGRNKLLSTMQLTKAAFRLRRVVSTISPMFVLTFMNKYNVYCLMATIGLRVNVVAAERDSPTEKLSLLRVYLRKILYPLASTILVQSEQAKEYLQSRIKCRRVVVLQNPVEAIISPEARAPEKVVLNVSRLHPKKGQRDLIRAFAAIRPKDWSLKFCGDGPARKELEDLAEELGVSAATVFMGTVEDLSEHLKSAGVFAFTSYWEGFPNALAEAMIAGLPCVSYDCPTGPSEMIQNGKNGVLVELGDQNSLASALLRLIDDREYSDSLGVEASKLASVLDVRVVASHYWDACIYSAKPHCHEVEG